VHQRSGSHGVLDAQGPSCHDLDVRASMRGLRANRPGSGYASVLRRGPGSGGDGAADCVLPVELLLLPDDFDVSEWCLLEALTPWEGPV
jgi:hypothetical protein